MILGHFLKFQATQSIAAKFIQELTQQKAEDNPYLDVYKKPANSGLQGFFSQNPQKPLIAPMNGQQANGMYPFPTGITQISPPTPNPGNPSTSLNGNSVLLQGTPPRRSLQGPNESVMPVPGGTIVLRQMQNGSLQIDNSQMPRQPPPVNSFSIYPNGTIPSAQAQPFPGHPTQQYSTQSNQQTPPAKHQLQSPAPPAKRTLKPKPSVPNPSSTVAPNTPMTCSATLPVNLSTPSAGSDATTANPSTPAGSPPDNASRTEKTPSETGASGMYRNIV